ncbi:hypothetical protein [Aromatoleum diolicum]|uniref:Uncharacterized protein n=1 Tax=Aromatoleum diolicum TaxID=75796 RepID=A0ABX1QE11_9RHOO|nr:hypothetical protein [Aromatoleum diolicum]NMG75310.1 hypothetical protein [Aromatoleum diolicum]
MVTIMDMNTGKVIEEPEEYGEEVLNASWLPPRPEPALQVQQVEHIETEPKAPPMDVEHFLEAVYRYQE